MTTTEFTATLRFTQPLRLHAERLREAISRPFFETPLRPATHDMLLLNAHPDLLPPEPPEPARDLTFFDLDRP